MSESTVRRIHLIQHSHTDVGYTATPSRVAAWQADFIRAAMGLAGDPSGEDSGFRWTCESFWGVEQFWSRATKGEQERFVKLVRAGRIALSASWLNMSELADLDLHRALASRFAVWAQERGLQLRCAMTADVNGNGLGHALSLAEQGVESLFTCVHSHHGFPPLKRHQPFWWDLPGGKNLLVYVGEHYHLGNELGLSPGAVSSYLIKDDCTAEDVYHDSWKVACRRIPRYLEKLEQAGVAVQELPLMISGLRTDNGPPSGLIQEQVERWNREHGTLVEIQLSTMEEAARALRKQEWPRLRGDWPDWWSDGAASRPMQVRAFRRALRERDLNAALANTLGLEDTGLPDLNHQLGLYAEHTFSHAASIHQPWHEDVQRIAAAKDACVSRALEMTADRQEVLLREMGHQAPAPGQAPSWEVMNPWPGGWEGPVLLRIEHFELFELKLDHPQKLLRVDKDQELPVQRIREGFLCWLKLEAGERARLTLHSDNAEPGSLDPDRRGGSDGVHDLLDSGKDPDQLLESPWLRLHGSRETGISNFTDSDGHDLLDRTQNLAPFTLIHEISPCDVPSDVAGSRARMGRNRKGSSVQRSHSRILSLRPVERGPLVHSLIMQLEVAGCPWVELELKAWQRQARLDLELRLHKESRWEAENLFFTLPVGCGELWLDRPAAPMCHARDQLPGTLVDYCSLDRGFARIKGQRWLSVTMPDQHLLQTGPLDPGPRQLMPPREDWSPITCAWLMSNYWETNFAAECGGFHSWRWSLRWGKGGNEVERVLSEAGDCLRECPVARKGEMQV